MNLITKNLPYTFSKYQYHFRDYFLAFVFAGLLNITLFGLMPGLIQSLPDKPELNTLASFQLVRIKHPETQIPKKEKIKIPEPEKKIIKQDHKPSVLSRPLAQKIRLPFQLNPKLPSGPKNISIPAIEMVSMKAPDLNGIFGVHELDNPLTPLIKIPPMYPIRAKRRGIQGWVKVKFLVNTEGKIEKLDILEAHPKNMFEKSVLNCVSKWSFRPGTVEGIPVKTWAETIIRFEMEN
ncbi:TonB family protein [Candidatus Magnetomorum sp. HK-1]|nr:TonB family protein [Candidatus Magnetomorum sp. HK-1]